MPAPTLDATPAGASANSYCTVVEADAYHDSVYRRTDWPATGSDTASIKEVALIEATRVLDSMYEWASWSTHPLTQALQWPRVSMLRRNRLSYVGNDEIPQELKNATAELARQLITADRTADSDVETGGITAITAGPVSINFKDSVSPKVIPDAVYSLLPAWWGSIKTRISATRELVR